MRTLFSTLLLLMLACMAIAQDTIVLRDFSFTPSTLTIPVGRKVVFRNQQGFHNVNGTQATFPGNPVSFGNAVAAAPWTYEFTFTTAGTYRIQCDPHAGQMQGTITVQNYPLYTIPVVTTENASGVADSLNKIAELRGVVYGGNLRTTGVQFTIIDRNNNGIGVFNTSKNFGYTVTQGDSIIVRGKIEQFNGLTQITADTIIRASQNNTLIEPTVVTTLGENTESKLIRIANVRLLSPAQWTNAAGGFNVNVTTTGTDTIVMRIDSEVDIFGKAVPTGTFTLTGIGGQFDSSNPFTSGYQIFPRNILDINPYVPSTAPEYPFYDISLLRDNAADGRPDSLGRKVEVQGTVYGVNIRGTMGLQFTIIDGSGDGIGIFSSTKTYGYTVTEGDSVTVRGTVDVFNGLTQILADTVIRVAQNRTLRAPSVVTALTETTESQLVRINGLMLSTPSQWTNAGTGFNVDASNGTTTFQIRIDADVNLFGQPAPTGKFDLIGIGGQFDNATPYDAGYQIIPRSRQDLILATSVIDPALAAGVKLYPNPVAEQLILENPDGFDRVRISNLLGQQLLEFKNIQTKAQFDVSQLAPGIYNLTLVRGNRAWAIEFVKQ